MTDQSEIEIKNPELKALADQAQLDDSLPHHQAEPDQVQENEFAPNAESIERARENARLVVAGLEKIFQFKEPRISFDDDVYQESESALAPALAKNSLQLPGWLERYREEIRASVFLGGVIFSSVMTIKELRELDEETAKESDSEPVKAPIFPDDEDLEERLKGVLE